MWLNISGQGLTVDAAVRERVVRQLRFALGRFGDHVGRVTVHLTDVNGPRGEDTWCRVVVEVLGHGRVMVEDTARDVQVAIDLAADRVGEAVCRRMERARLYACLADVKSVGGQN